MNKLYIYCAAALVLALLALVIYAICLKIKLSKKQIIDQHELENYQKEVDAIYVQKNKEEIELHSLRQRINDSLDEAERLDANVKATAAKAMEIVNEKVQQDTEKANEELNILKVYIDSRKQDYDNLMAPMRLLEKERQEKLFYSIHLTNDEKSDIIYLLDEVAPHINHRDILSKLVWQEFIKNPLEDTLKRVGITQTPGIYKLTNMTNGMCYVGKSTNVKKRIQDHFKSVVGILSISDQKIHHEIMAAGIDNWTIEQVCECTKEELNEKEKFYIEFFNAIEYGYNVKAGG